MVNEAELKKAIADCHSLPVTYQNCEKLAVFLFLEDKLYGEKNPVELRAEKYGGSEFLDAISDKPLMKIMPILDELMTVVHDLMPTVYNEVVSRIESIS